MTPTKLKLPAAERRAAIVDTAVEMFARLGFRGVTTRELAAAVGVSEPVLYQHFATKQALYDAILEERLAHLDPAGQAELDALDASGDIRAYLTRLAEMILGWYLTDPRYIRLLMFSALDGHELAQMFYERRVAIYYDLLTRYLERQMEAGRVRRMEPLLAARTFTGMVSHQGLIYSVYIPGELAGSPEDVVRGVVDIFLNGMAL